MPDPVRAKPGCCVHFTAVLGPQAKPACRAGVVYADLAGTAPGWAMRLPCNVVKMHAEKPPVPCDKRQEPTEEQVEAWRAFVDGSLAGIMEAGQRVQAQHKATGAYDGTVECPRCGGALRWAMARSNRHVHAACERKGCVAWMQ